MVKFLRRRRSKTVPVVEFCEPCGQACAGQCRAATQLDRARVRALQLPGIR